MLDRSIFDPVCLVHGKKKSEHDCLFCCMCFKDLTKAECIMIMDPDTGKEICKIDVCAECAKADAKANA